MKLTRLTLLSIIALSTSGIVRADVQTHTIDPAHTLVGFKVRHFFTKVSGRFNNLSGVIKIDPTKPEGGSVNVQIDASSIDTANEKRDTHLKSPDFFDTSKFSDISFKSKTVKKTSDTTADVTGDLTIHGVTKEIVLAVKYLGQGPDMDGKPRSGWEATAKLNRKDFGLTWGKTVEGTAVVADEVEIDLQVEAIVE